MATALQPLEYEPVPVPPPGGLLAAAVGDPLAPQPPINPNEYENDDVVGRLNAITSADSGYMQLARTSGLQTANRRGLLNTSIAAGASQAAAIAAAAPLASQSAAQAAQRNLTRLGAHFTAEQQAKDIEARERMLATQLRSEEERLGRQLTAQEQAQLRDIATQKELQANQIASAKTLAELNIAAESERLGRQLTAQEQLQIRDLAAQQTRLSQQLTSQEALTREGYAAELARAKLAEAGATSRAQLDASTRIQMATLANAGENQRAALNYYLGKEQIYAQSVSNLYANENLPAPARDAAIQSFLALKNTGMNLPGALFGANMTWGGVSATPTTTTTAPTTSTYRPPTTTTTTTRLPTTGGVVTGPGVTRYSGGLLSRMEA